MRSASVDLSTLDPTAMFSTFWVFFWELKCPYSPLYRCFEFSSFKGGISRATRWQVVQSSLSPSIERVARPIGPRNPRKWSNMIGKWSKTVGKGPKWQKERGRKWSKMAENGRKCTKTRKINIEDYRDISTPKNISKIVKISLWSLMWTDRHQRFS